jgi:hypothetical protein
MLLRLVLLAYQLPVCTVYTRAATCELPHIVLLRLDACYNATAAHNPGVSKGSDTRSGMKALPLATPLTTLQDPSSLVLVTGYG